MAIGIGYMTSQFLERQISLLKEKKSQFSLMGAFGMAVKNATRSLKQTPNSGVKKFRITRKDAVKSKKCSVIKAGKS